MNERNAVWWVLAIVAVWFAAGIAVGYAIWGGDNHHDTKSKSAFDDHELIFNAKQYADWCGGFVTVTRKPPAHIDAIVFGHGNVIVQGCDR